MEIFYTMLCVQSQTTCECHSKSYWRKAK